MNISEVYNDNTISKVYYKSFNEVKELNILGRYKVEWDYIIFDNIVTERGFVIKEPNGSFTYPVSQYSGEYFLTWEEANATN